MKIEPLAVRVSDAAEAISVSVSMCYSLIAAGQLRSIRVGRRATRVPVEALRDFILDRQAETIDDVPAGPSIAARVDPAHREAARDPGTVA